MEQTFRTAQRTWVSDDSLSSAVARAMGEKGGLTVANMRGPGFRAMEAALMEEGAFRTAAPLPENAQRIIDNAVIEVGMDRLTVTGDLIARGLTYNLDDPLGVTQIEWQMSNRTGNAQRTMSPEARGERQIPNMLAGRLPVYLTTDDFSLGIRELKMSRRVGMPLDTTLIQHCTRSVNEAIEDATINGATTIDGQDLQVAGYKAYGLLNHPNVETQTLTAAAWDVTPVGATVYAEIQAMIAKLRANKKFGPYAMYYNTEIGAALDSDYDTTSGSRGLTIRERIAKIDGLEVIKSADMIPGGTAGTMVGAKVVIFQMTKDVIDIVVGQRPTVIPWTSLSGFTFFNLVMAIIIPRVRNDYDGNSGIVVGTAA